ncbi:MAG: hypothetical protein ACK5HS_02125 [Mycoplasmatales bacterium]
MFFKKNKVKRTKQINRITDTKLELQAQVQEILNQEQRIDLDINKFYDYMLEVLKAYNCSFGYQRSDSKKHGHFKIKTDRVTGEETWEIKIERNDNDAGKIYTLIHETTHLLNNHVQNRELTKKQAEVVADTVALHFIYKFNLKEELNNSSVSKKWDVDQYTNTYIKNMSLSNQRKELIIKQIDSTIDYLDKGIYSL